MTTSKPHLNPFLYTFFVLLSLTLTAVAARPGTPLATKEQLRSYVKVVTTDSKQCIQDLGTSNPCWEISVSCTDPTGVTLLPRTGYISFGNTTATPTQGMIMLIGGGGGTGFWQGSSSETENAISELNQAGFETAQLRWLNPWMISATGDAADGHANLACPSAAVAAFLDNLFTDELNNGAFCVSGNSGGAAQGSYMLTHYGLEQQIDLAVLTSGPPLGRIDWGCLSNIYSAPYEYDEDLVDAIDRAFTGNNLHCTNAIEQSDTTSLAILGKASVAFGGDYRYQNTDIAFLFGADDTTNAVDQGLTYASTLMRSRHSMISIDVLPDVAHDLHFSVAGATAISDILQNRCVAK